jgi:hypothetical protein
MKSPLIFFFLILVLPLALAVPPITTTQQFTTGYEIGIPQDNVLKVGQDYSFEFHVYNISNGVPKVSGIMCLFHLYDSSGKHQLEMWQGTADHNFDYGFDVAGANFTVGEYYYTVQCNNSALGGFHSAVIEVTSTGLDISWMMLLILYAFAIIFMFASIITDEEFLLYISGIMFLVAGIYIMINGIDYFSNDLYTKSIAYISLGLGMLFTLGSYVFNKFSLRGEKEEEIE